MRALRVARNIAFVLAATAGIAACAGDPVAPGDDDTNKGGHCIWIDAVLHCSRGA